MSRCQARDNDAPDALNSLAGNSECAAARQCGQQLRDMGRDRDRITYAPTVRPDSSVGGDQMRAILINESKRLQSLAA
jgi:hypothetical protein